MDPRRKRKVRFVVALSAAVVLAAALVYTSFSASSEARTPSQLLAAAQPGEVYQLTGKVEPGYTKRGHGHALPGARPHRHAAPCPSPTTARCPTRSGRGAR